MSTDTTNPTLTPAVALENTPPAMLSPEEVVQLLRGLRLQLPLPSGEVANVARRRRISRIDAKFVEATINAIGASTNVQQALGRTDEELRQELDTAARWTAVADELRSLLASILDANTVRRHRINLVALQAYSICQQLARDESNARLGAHIGEMKRLNRFGRARRKPALPSDEPLESQPSAPR